jgi:hypothetical protein
LLGSPSCTVRGRLTTMCASSSFVHEKSQVQASQPVFFAHFISCCRPTGWWNVNRRYVRHFPLVPSLHEQILH